ncbi:hypothetical protein LguiB_008907 [Lonicera macranthoides]
MAIHPRPLPVQQPHLPVEKTDAVDSPSSHLWHHSQPLSSVFHYNLRHHTQSLSPLFLAPKEYEAPGVRGSTNQDKTLRERAARLEPSGAAWTGQYRRCYQKIYERLIERTNVEIRRMGDVIYERSFIDPSASNHTAPTASTLESKARISGTSPVVALQHPPLKAKVLRFGHTPNKVRKWDIRVKREGNHPREEYTAHKRKKEGECVP